MIKIVENTGRFLKLETSRYVNDIKSGCKTGHRQYKTSGSGNVANDVYLCSKNVYKNWKSHRNLLTGPICVAGVFLPGGIIFAPLALYLIRKLRKF